MNHPPLKLEHARFGYHSGHDVVRSVDLSIMTGTATALLGPNGSGKTTLLKLAVGLLRPDHGCVQLWGRPSTRMNPSVLRRIGYVSENQTLPLHLDIGGLCALPDTLSHMGFLLRG